MADHLTGGDEIPAILENLVAHMPDYIYAKDRESRFIFANKHVAHSHGISDPSSMKGKTDFDYYPEEVARSFYEDEQAIMASGKPIINKEETFLDNNRNKVVLSTTKIPFRDAGGKVAGIVGIGREITRQKLVEKRYRELSTVASATENVVVIMDRDGNFEWVNKKFEERYGKDLGTFVRDHGRNLRDNSSNEEIDRIVERILQTGNPETYSSRTTDSKGKEIWYQTSISPIQDEQGEITGLFLIDSDVTLLKQAEAMINRQKSELESQRDELKKLNASKDRLFSIIAHDLKNPFQSIIGFSQLLLENPGNISDQQVRDYLQYIYDSSSSAYALLQNLLEWSRAQTRRVQINPVEISLKEAVEETVRSYRSQAGSKEIALELQMDPSLHCLSDPRMLQTILRNLTSNAVKFTRKGGRITFTCESSEGMAHLHVRDSGVGIPEERIGTLFAMDKEGSTPGTDGESGTGLGLLLCREFVKLNNGRISVESRVGKGTTFTVSLPLPQGKRN